MIEVMQHSFQQSSPLQEFQYNFYKLNAYPDKDLIENLTTFTQNHTHLAVEIVQIICSRLTDNNMPNTFKLPIFYLMDSIIKYTRDSFIPLFAQYLENIYTIIFQNMSDKDKAKLDFLFKTWEERCQLGQPQIGLALLKKMRDQISYLLPIAPVTQLSNTSYNTSKFVPNIQVQQVPIAPDQSNNVTAWPNTNQFVDFDSIQKKYLDLQTSVSNGLVSNNVISDVNYYSNSSVTSNYPNNTYNSSENTATNTTQYSNNSSSQPSKRLREDNSRKSDRRNRSRRSRSNDHIKDNYYIDDKNKNKMNKSIDDNSLQIEMNNLLNKLLNDLGQSNKMSLNELKIENYQLYEQIRIQAENNLKTSNQSKSDNKNNHPSFVYGYINESSTIINIENTLQLHNRLDSLANNKNSSNIFNLPAVTFTNSRQLSNKIELYIRQINEPTKLPSLLFGQLPNEPSKGYQAKLHSVNLSDSSINNQAVVKPNTLTPFKFEDINIRPTLALKALINDRPFICNEDGKRFATSDLLKQHNNKLIAGRIEKLNKVRRGEVNDERKSRPWYTNLITWIGINKSDSIVKSDVVNDKKSLTTLSNEEFIVPADEFFIRCPISKELFERVWDDDEGEWMYRNAVKVLVTESADPVKYQLGHQTTDPSVRYMIVRKPLIVDSWLTSGTASTLNDAVKRYRSINKSDDYINKLLSAAGEDEDGDDIFVLLELNK